MKSSERDLRGRGEKQLVALDLVHVRVVRREPARADECLFADEDGRQHGDEPLPGQAVDGEAVHSESEQRHVADPVAEARARHARGALHVEPTDLRVLLHLGQRGRLAHAPDLFGLVLAHAVGHRRVRRVRHTEKQLLPLGLGPRKCVLGGAQILLHLLQLGHFLCLSFTLAGCFLATLFHAGSVLSAPVECVHWRA